MTDPGLKGPDPVWLAVRGGKGHVYYVLLGIVALSVWLAGPRWPEALTAAFAGGVLADLWAHEYLH